MCFISNQITRADSGLVLLQDNIAVFSVRVMVVRKAPCAGNGRRPWPARQRGGRAARERPSGWPEGVPSPGCNWKQSVRRKSKWVASSLWGSPKRFMGILHNELYIGRRVWNRFTWIRSAADSSKRRIVLNPEAKWIVHEREDLRIVSQKLWDRVRLRHSEQSKSIGYRVKQGLDKAKSASDNRRQALEVEIVNLSHAIVDGALKSSPAIIDPHLWMSVFGYQPSNRSMSLGDWFPIQSTTFLAVNSNSRAEPAPRSIH